MNAKFPSITRRAILKNLALGTATTLSGSLAAFADTPVKGPIVWLDMDQQELDKAYSQFMYAPNIQEKYKSGKRGAAAGDMSGAQMRAAAGILMDATDIQNVVAYINSLASH